MTPDIIAILGITALAAAMTVLIQSSTSKKEEKRKAQLKALNRERLVRLKRCMPNFGFLKKSELRNRKARG
jgi:hypothetical protein